MQARLAAAVAVVAVGIVAFAAPRSSPTDPCPEATHSDPQRSQRLVRLLAGSVEGAQLLRRVGHVPRTCFGPVDDGVLRSDGVAVMADRQADAAAAARLGHLLLHQADGFAFEDRAGDRPCSERVAAAIVAEARAHALELRLRRELLVSGRLLPPEVESAFWSSQRDAGGDAAVEVLRRELARGGSGSLAEAYARRCRD